MQPRCVRVVEIAAILSPSRTIHTRRVSRETRAPEGKSSGLPIEKRLGCPYVARGLIKMRFDSAVMISEPNSPKPLSHDNTLRRVTASPVSSIVGLTFILFLPRRTLDQFLHIRPEHLILRVFQVPEVVLLHGEHEDEYRSNPHAQTGDDRDPCQFHRYLSPRSIRAVFLELLRTPEIQTVFSCMRYLMPWACAASIAIEAPPRTLVMAACASAHT